ncbi:hypothetical protein IT418_02850 [bacterium]|nr:hypothetical protein [bacterium]
MIRLNKKILITIFVLFLTGIVGSGAWFLNKEISKKWDDSTTWSTEGKVGLPVQASSNYKITTVEEGGQFKITVPFCVLYEVAIVTENKFDYYCAAIPYSSIELTKRFPDKIKFTKDIVVSYNSDIDALPTSFLNYITIDKEALKSIGSDVKPVSISMSVTYQKPSTNFRSMVAHYQTVKSGEKESYVGMRVSEWKVDLVKQASEYSPSEKKEIIKKWRAQAWKDVNNLLKTQSYLDMPNSKELLIEMAKWMVFRNMYCPTAQVKEECDLGYEENASSNLMYYTYSAFNLEKKRFDRITDALRERVMPFVLESNPELVQYYLDCDTATECNYYHRLELYDYPACPILELGKGGQSEIAKLFLDFRSPTLGDEYSQMDLSKSGILAKFATIKNEFVSSKSLRRLSYDSVQNFDKLCYKILKDNVTDAEVITTAKNVYIHNYLGQVFIEESKFANVDTDTAIFDLVLQSSKLNPYAYTTVPSPVLSYKRLLTGVQKQDNQREADGYWASLNSTMILLYLTSNY